MSGAGERGRSGASNNSSESDRIYPNGIRYPDSLGSLDRLLRIGAVTRQKGLQERRDSKPRRRASGWGLMIRRPQASISMRSGSLSSSRSAKKSFQRCRTEALLREFIISYWLGWSATKKCNPPKPAKLGHTERSNKVKLSFQRRNNVKGQSIGLRLPATTVSPEKGRARILGGTPELPLLKKGGPVRNLKGSADSCELGVIRRFAYPEHSSNRRLTKCPKVRLPSSLIRINKPGWSGAAS